MIKVLLSLVREERWLTGLLRQLVAVLLVLGLSTRLHVLLVMQLKVMA